MNGAYDLICLSHLRWDFVYQRPQQLMGRCARNHRVYFVEEPVFDSEKPWLHVSERPEPNVHVLVAHLPWGPAEQEHGQMYRALLDAYRAEQNIDNFVLWYYTPMMASWTSGLEPESVVYDCMDELSAFKDAPAELIEREAALLKRADLVFTGGQSLYEAKKNRHERVYAFPSSVDASFFAMARSIGEEADDQIEIPHPRIGFYGVVDERLDVDLLAKVAELRPEWHWIIVGPTVSKIDENTLPRNPNIHYLGSKKYAQLPLYLAGWDVAMLPFARNESTRFISPTKTPEYLAAGKPVVSTSIKDVIRPYGELGLAHIADSPADFAAACEAAMAEDAALRIETADDLLSRTSWDKTWSQMAELIDTAVAGKKGK